LVNRQPNFLVVAIVSVVLAAVAGLGVAALWPDRAASATQVATGSRTSSPSSTTTAPAITLRIDKSRAAPGERIHLTGNGGGPAIALEVQERGNNAWVNFPARGTTRSDGNFASFVVFGRAGEHVLRMVAPGTSRVSNSVTVTIG
jgi:ABC-type phosphate transport system substrate-binding protein